MPFTGPPVGSEIHGRDRSISAIAGRAPGRRPSHHKRRTSTASCPCHDVSTPGALIRPYRACARLPLGGRLAGPPQPPLVTARSGQSSVGAGINCRRMRAFHWWR
jgi:hypothetical protein